MKGIIFLITSKHLIFLMWAVVKPRMMLVSKSELRTRVQYHSGIITPQNTSPESGLTSLGPNCMRTNTDMTITEKMSAQAKCQS
mmetsp:Transcript_21133/g.56321  ORF Transcript_21133/g.56321 Transcript_21133/m.56321 type:complete len:84 (-) Transcript_21133:149-400(-)